MENNNKEPEVKCLFEDGNPHEHNEKSYEKMMEHQQNNQSNNE